LIHVLRLSEGMRPVQFVDLAKIGVGAAKASKTKVVFEG
jgi:hypothetical protein